MTTSVIASGTHYKLGCVLALRIENDEPVFGIVESMNEKNVIFLVSATELVEYDNHFHCYVLQFSSVKEDIYQRNFLDHLPLHKKTSPFSKSFVVFCYTKV